ncbi:uncharacterized protein F4822DRAFT_383489 [Hypoxylon trugodes]|uniref:uncharacterized protein n=1 Tax=Hypoxylon trugodes TaxID=326681 RepID=UPI0021A043C2|nr:uncharacterized protein F4822DRAFT_383489 [Hypoxylon trugodes]KAI1385116.1 hypothetical protein F4822DRAFT_383489 [Hypoxylon trugodes]
MTSVPSNIDLSHIPLLPAPPGEVTNFVNPPSISWAGRLAIYLTLPIMVIAFILRSFVRIRNRQFGADDYLLSLGVASAVSFCAVILPIFNDDILGRHAWDIPVSEIQPWFFQYSTVVACLYNMSAMFTKISILTLYFRVFHPSDWARNFIWPGIAMISIGYLVLTSAILYYLIPHKGDGGWGSDANRQREGVPSRVIDFTSGVFSAFSDLYVLTIPTFVIAGLNLQPKKKIGIACIFLTGLLSCGCSITGLVFRYRALVYTVEDNRWLSVKFEALCVAELNIGISCACIPVFFVLFRSFMQRTESGFDYMRRFLSPRHSVTANASGVTVEHRPEISLRIPKGTLTGLQSIFRKAGRTQSKNMDGVNDVLASQYLELQSIDYDYHARARQDSRVVTSH